SGPSARIEPEVGSAVVDSTALAQGRIVARIRSDSTYPQAGFGPWWTYWWVDKQGGHWRSLFIRSDSGSKPRVPTGFVLYHPPRPRPGAGPRPHGDRLPRHRREARPARGHQSAAADDSPLPGERALPARSPLRGAAFPPQHRPPLRSRRSGRVALLRDGVRGGGFAEGSVGARRAARRGRGDPHRR